MGMTIGVDLGKANDSTAVCIIEEAKRKTGVRRWMETVRPGVATTVEQDEHEAIFNIRHVEEMLGVPYPEVADRLKELTSRPELRDADVVVDATGLGTAVLDFLREKEIGRLVGIIITGGDNATRDGSDWRVPKRDIIAALEVPLQNGQVKYPGGAPWKDRFLEQAKGFAKSFTSTGHDRYEHRTSTGHDDIVLSIAMALWHRQRVGEDWLFF